MLTMTMPMRGATLLRQVAVNPSTAAPGLNLRLNARSYTRSARPWEQARAARGPIAIAAPAPSAQASRGKVLALLGGAGLALYASSLGPHLALDFESPFSKGGVGSSRKNFSLDDLGNDSHPFDGSDDLPKSDLNVYNLGFGSFCGICAGIFIKKGLKFVAFLLGGSFVLLQYLNTQRIIKVDWKKLSSGYDSAVDRAAGRDAIEINKPSRGWSDSTAARIWNRFVHFLSADFPSRGTFLAGLVLGLRLG